MRTGNLLGFFAFALQGLPADVAATKAFRPFDAIDRRISPALCLGDVLSCRADVEHAPAIGNNLSVLQHCARMEYLDALDFGGFIETANDGALAVIAGIALRGQDHRKRRIVVPPQAEVLQLPIRTSDQC